MDKKTWIPVASFALLFVALAAVNVLAGLVPLRLDITQQHIYTLADGSRAILAGLKEPVTIKLYLPESSAEVPVTVKTFSRRVRELLEEYRSASRGRLTLQVFNPKPDSEDEEWAQRYGLSAARLPDGTNLYFGMVALSGGREAAVPFFDPRRERLLEYDISQAIARVNQQTRAKVGVLSWLPVMGGMGPGGQPTPEWAVMQELRKSYQVQSLFPSDLTEVPDDIGLVLVVDPKAVSDTVSYALDQFLLRGGKLIVFADPHSRMEGGQGFGGAGGGLPKLFSAWGITFDADHVVADRGLATRVNAPNEGVVDYPLWISLHQANMSHDLAITSMLDDVTLIDTGAFSTAKDFKYKFTPLFTSSAQSGLIDQMTARFSGPMDIIKQLKTDDTQRVLAGLVSGTLETAFPGGAPPPPPADPKDKAPKPAEKPRKHAHLAQAARETSVLLVGDADFIADRFSVQTVNFFGNAVTQPINDNLAFALNAVEFMSGSQDLIQIRSRGQLTRPFTRVLNLQARAAAQYQQQERLLSQRLEEVKRKLQELQNTKQPGQKLVLTAAQVEEVGKFRKEEARVHGQLREVRKVLRQDIENLGNILLTINLLLMPLLVAVLGVVVIGRRARRSGGKP
jgi:ABC-type uncharacterized transport system involved in gliding motility auxiliary subunit